MIKFRVLAIIVLDISRKVPRNTYSHYILAENVTIYFRNIILEDCCHSVFFVFSLYFSKQFGNNGYN